MAVSCKQQQERVEKTVLQPLDKWVRRHEQQCKTEPCKWWMLCLNKVLCWLVWTVVKISVLVVTIVVRWVYRLVCTVVSLVNGLIALIFGNPNILLQALSDFWELVKDAFYTALGAVIYFAIAIVDGIQSILGIQNRKRPLTEQERIILGRIFRESLYYNAISIIGGNAGLLSISNRPFTMGFNIYMPSYSEATLVHECVHVWQFQFEGTKYIGQSALTQLDSMYSVRGTIHMIGWDQLAEQVAGTC